MGVIARSKTHMGFMFAVMVIAVGVSIGFAAFARAENPAAAPDGEQTQYFLKLDSIEGDATDAQHKNEIEPKSFAWSSGKPGLVQQATVSTGGGAGAGKVSMNDIHFTARVGKASPKLMLATATGTHSKEATLVVRSTKGKQQQEYFKLKMTDVVVSSYTVGSSNDSPTDEFDLHFAKVEESFVPTAANGVAGEPIIGRFDVVENRAF